MRLVRRWLTVAALVLVPLALLVIFRTYPSTDLRWFYPVVGAIVLTSLVPVIALKEPPKHPDASPLELRVVAPPRIRTAIGDRRRVEQILTNLAGNALKFGPVDGSGLVELAATLL